MNAEKKLLTRTNQFLKKSFFYSLFFKKKKNDANSTLWVLFRDFFSLSTNSSKSFYTCYANGTRIFILVTENHSIEPATPPTYYCVPIECGCF